MDTRTIRILSIGAVPDLENWLNTLLKQTINTRFHLIHDELVDHESPVTDNFDVILLILSLVDNSGLDLFAIVKTKYPQSPIIVLTDTSEEFLSLEVIRLGAKDCLIRNQMNSHLLTRSIIYAVERQKAETELSHREARFRKVINNNADGVIIVDQGGIVRFVNPAIEALFERPAKDLLGMMFGFPVIAGETAELDILRGNRIPAVAEMRVVEIEWEGEIAYLASLRDITERKQYEAQERELITERERTRVLQQFISDASHDLKTPLTTIFTQLYLLRRQMADQNQERIDKIESHAKHLVKLLDDMLQMSRLDTMDDLKSSKFGLGRLVQGIIQGFQFQIDEKEQVLSFEDGNNNLQISGDEFLVGQAIENVLRNSVNYTAQGQAIDVKVFEENGQAVIEVVDSGTGIAGEHLDKIFERFYRVDSARNTISGGTGLGLAIVKRVVELHKGKIEADSQLGQGTTMRIYLPIHHSQ